MCINQIIIDKNTFIGSRKGEEDVPHHYTDKEELISMLNGFSKVKIMKLEYFYYDLRGDKQSSKVYDVMACK